MIGIWFFKVKSCFEFFPVSTHDCRFGVEKWNGKGDLWGKKDQMLSRKTWIFVLISCRMLNGNIIIEQKLLHIQKIN